MQTANLGQWSLCLWNDMLIACHPKHIPIVIDRNGKAEKLFNPPKPPAPPPVWDGPLADDPDDRPVNEEAPRRPRERYLEVTVPAGLWCAEVERYLAFTADERAREIKSATGTIMVDRRMAKVFIPKDNTYLVTYSGQPA